MTRSFLTRCAALALGLALTAGGLATAARADANAPIVVIVMENHGYGPTDSGVNGDTAKYIVGNTVVAPFINGTLIPSGTLFSNYYSLHHPSLPDYLEITGGTNAGCTIDSCPRDALTNENLFHLLGAAGTSFNSFAESMPSNCATTNTGNYVARHNPEVYYTNVDALSGLPYACPTTDLALAPVAAGTPSAWPNPLPAFSFVAPDICHDMHGTAATGVCPKDTSQIVTDGDTWLSANVPALLSEGAIVILTWDEGASGDATGGGGHVATVMVGPGVPAGVTDAAPYNHQSLAGGLEDYFGVSPLLAGAATATPVVIPRTTPYTVPTVTGLTPETGAIGDPVTIAGTGLTNAYAVQFAGTPASFTVNSDSSITASVPTGVTTGTVTVSTAGGTATSPDIFTAPPPPTGPTLVQHAVGNGTKSMLASATWSQATAAGDLQVATIGWSGAAKVTTPAGWSLAVSSGGTAVYYRQNGPVVSGAMTFSLSAKASWVVSLSEWSGIATSGALDKTAHKAGTVSGPLTASSGTTATTVQPVELAIAGVRAQVSLTESAPTNGFTQLDQQNAGTNDTLGIYGFVSSAAGKLSTSVTLSAHANWHGAIATFRAP